MFRGCYRRRELPLLAGLPFALTLLFTTAAIAAEVEKSAEDSQIATPPAARPLSPRPIDAPAVSFGWSLTAANKYLWQGLDYSNGDAVLQPSAILGYRGFSASIWTNYDLPESRPDEFDFTLQYGIETPVLTIAPGLALLRYPHRDGWAPASEATLDLTASLPFEPSLGVHYDYSAGQGLYATFGIARSVGPAPLGLRAAANLFYERGYYDLTGIPAFELNLTRDFTLGAVTVTPSVSRFTTWANGDFRGDARVPAAWQFSLTVSQGS
jgi:hypothetical protein